MSVNKEIYTQAKTMSNLITSLKARMRGIATDGDKEFTYKDADGVLHVLPANKTWNGSTWDYKDIQFKDLTVNSLTVAQDLLFSSLTLSGDLNLSGLTASKVLVLDEDKDVATSAVSTTELGYLSGKNSVIDGSGSVGYIPKMTGTGRIGNSVMYEGTSALDLAKGLRFTNAAAETLSWTNGNSIDGTYLYFPVGSALFNTVEVTSGNLSLFEGDLFFEDSNDTPRITWETGQFISNTEMDFTYFLLGQNVGLGAKLTGIMASPCGTFSSFDLIGWHKGNDPDDDDPMVKIIGQKGATAGAIADTETIGGFFNHSTGKVWVRGNGDIETVGALNVTDTAQAGSTISGPMNVTGLFEVFDDAIIYGSLTTQQDLYTNDFSADGNASVTGYLNVTDLDSAGSVISGVLDVTGDVICNGLSKQTTGGGFAVYLYNNSGTTIAAGELVIASSATGSFTRAGTNAYDCFGVAESSIASASSGWIVISGLANVLMDSNGSTSANFVRTSSATAGSARAEAVPTPGTADTHFKEIGHCLETRTGAGLAKCVLHFN